MRRRDFITVLGGAAVAWPIAASAQKTMPVIGFLHPGSIDAYANRLRAFHRGLKEAGYTDGENVAIEYRWADNQTDRLQALAVELASRRVSVIVSSPGPAPALAAKAATKTIPIVFLSSGDPVGTGLVASLAKPGGNLTGVNFFNNELNAKRLEFLHQLVPTASNVAVLVNPANPANSDNTLREVEAAARTIGLQIRIVLAATSRDIDAAFVTFARERPDALFVGGDALLNARRLQIAQHAVRLSIPAAYASRDYPEVGGLMSYGTNVAEAFRQLGVYAGRVLKGEKPAEMPVVQSTKFELVINNQTARTIGLTVPQSLLVAADDVIE